MTQGNYPVLIIGSIVIDDEESVHFKVQWCPDDFTIDCLQYFRNDDDKDNNLWIGLCWIIFFFLVVSVLAFPNGKTSS